MELIFYDDIEAFLNVHESKLKEEEAVHQLILGNAYRLKASKEKPMHFMGACYQQHDILLIFLYMAPYNLLVDAFRDVSLEDLYTLTYHIHQRYPHIPGINAPFKIAEPFCNFFHQLSGKFYYKRLGMDIMILKSFLPVQIPEGNMRLATMEDLELVNEWVLSFHQESLNEAANPDEVHQGNMLRIEQEKLHLFINEAGKRVAMGSIARYLHQGAALSLIYTDIKERHKGYGLAITYHMSKKILDAGYDFVTLFVDKSNPISNRVYLKLGFEIVTNQYDYRFID